MKRFYTTATVGAPDGGGWPILLDGRPVRTPARALLAPPARALADAIVGEWLAQAEAIDPATMPFTGLANAAIDRVAPDPGRFAAPLAAYAETDLLCYRAEAPASLVEAQAAAWDPLLAWAATRYDVAFERIAGIVHRQQPDATVRRLAAATAALPVFALAGLSPLVTIGGSLVAALAVIEGAIAPADAFAATHVDELWQVSRWGEDALAQAARETRARDFVSAARFVALL